MSATFNYTLLHLNCVYIIISLTLHKHKIVVLVRAKPTRTKIMSITVTITRILKKWFRAKLTPTDTVYGKGFHFFPSI